MQKLFAIIIAILLITTITPTKTSATQNTQLPLQAPAAILIEQSTGRILYARNEHERMFPASMTKILASIVVLEYLNPDDIITVGAEIRNMPPGFDTRVHAEGETITVRMLLRAFLIRSGNETGRILALHTIRRRLGNDNIQYAEAKRLFSVLMNERARSLGARNTHFNNPYGLHSESHYTTAYDMALISRAFMEVPLLAEIVSYLTFTGDSLEGQQIQGGNPRTYVWTNHNQMLPHGTFSHPHVTGIKTGFTDAAGYCLAGSATRNNLSLISVVFNSPVPGRWHDTRLLFDYGFDNFAFRRLLNEGDILDEVIIHNPRRGYSNSLQIIAASSQTALLSNHEYENLTRIISFNPAFLPDTPNSNAPENYEPEDGKIRLLAPIEAGTVVGTISYYADGKFIFTANIIAAAYAYPRSFDSDLDYFVATIVNNIFTLRGLPYWFGIIGILFGFLGINIAIKANTARHRAERWQVSNSREIRSNKYTNPRRR